MLVYQVNISKLMIFFLLSTCLLQNILVLYWEIRSSSFIAISVVGWKRSLLVSLLEDDKNASFANYASNLTGRPYRAGKGLNSIKVSLWTS